MLESKNICEVVTVEEDSNFRDFIASNPSGLRIVPEVYREGSQPLVKAEAGNFAKWIMARNTSINVDLDEECPRLILRSGDIYLPLIYLASDIALPVYLNLVSSFLWEQMKGALKSDKTRVHFSAVYEDKISGTVKRFKFEGDADALNNAIKRFDLNRFLDE